MLGRFLNKGGYVLCALAIVFLAFVGGLVVAVAHIFPSELVRNAYRAGNALALKYSYYSDPFNSNLWTPARTARRGVTVPDTGRAYPGLTLYTSGEGNKAVLVNLDGEVVHEWRRPFSTVWDESAATHSPVPDNQVYFRKAHVFPNGDLLAIYIGAGDTPWGYGLVKLDKDSNVIWKNLDHFHHDFAITNNGTIYGLTHSFRKRPLEGASHLDLPVIEDFLVMLSPEGKTLKKISLLEAVNRSPYSRLLERIWWFTLWDPLHTNSIEVLDSKMAAHLRPKIPVAAPGQVLISFRELAGGTIALLDVAQEKIVWATRGPWMAQHDADVLPNGNLLLFDNLGHLGPGGMSRILEVDPGTTDIVWSYSGTPAKPLDNYLRGAQQLLPNGNVLITESNPGRLLEVAPNGDIVWEFYNPARGGKNNELIAVVSYGQRIDPATLAPSFRAEIAGSVSAEVGK
ncbi:MAG: arylsulfotransferase family protein [Nitrococcus sp.]|nr:arylsulfotransferase family protein [Nitrococcus sp.]